MKKKFSKYHDEFIEFTMNLHFIYSIILLPLILCYLFIIGFIFLLIEIKNEFKIEPISLDILETFLGIKQNY